jgi:hypothetical protein
MASSTYCEGGVEEENSLLSPSDEASVRRRFNPKVRKKLLVDILEGWGDGNAWPDAKAQAMGLSEAMVWVLADNNNAHLVKRR